MTTPTYTDPADRKLPHPGEIIAPGVRQWQASKPIRH